MQPLAKVTKPLSEHRGPDVRCTVTVPRDWLRCGATITIDPPRLASCAACDGGGCDTCRSQGALTLRERDAETESLVVHLAPDSGDGPQLIRLPGHGAAAWEPEHPRGCLLLEVQPGEQPSSGVGMLDAQATLRPPIVWSLNSVLTVAVLLALLFAALVVSGK